MKRWQIEVQASAKGREARQLRLHGNSEAAIPRYEEMLTLYKRLDDRVLLYNTFKDMGDAACEMQDFAAARHYYEHSGVIFKNKLQLWRHHAILKCLKNTSIKEQDWPRAYRELKYLLSLSSDRPDVEILQELAEVSNALGDTAESDSYFVQVLSLTINSNFRTIKTLQIWGMILFQRGQVRLACQLYRLAVLLSEQSAERSSESLYAKPYSFGTEASVDRDWNEVAALRQELKALGCDNC